jgi:hypothetical protein
VEGLRFSAGWPRIQVSFNISQPVTHGHANLDVLRSQVEPSPAPDGREGHANDARHVTVVNQSFKVTCISHLDSTLWQTEFGPKEMVLCE